jgi:hypothetical protein
MAQPNEQIVITEEFAVKVYSTGRGVIAEIADYHSKFNGLYVLASVRAYALPMLLDRVAEMKARQLV